MTHALRLIEKSDGGYVALDEEDENEYVALD